MAVATQRAVYQILKSSGADTQYGSYGSWPRARAVEEQSNAHLGLLDAPAARELYDLAGEFDKACGQVNSFLSSGNCPAGGYEQAQQIQEAATAFFKEAAEGIKSPSGDLDIAAIRTKAGDYSGAMRTQAEILTTYAAVRAASKDRTLGSW